MSEDDPGRLADELEREAGEMKRGSDKLGARTSDVREDWRRKRSAADVPGAVPEEGNGEGEPEEEGSPAAEAPSEDEGPGEAQTPSEGAAGPPADSDD